MHKQTNLDNIQTCDAIAKVCPLNDTERNILCNIVRGIVRVEVIADKLNKDRSTVQKFLYRLIDLGLVRKESKCCDPSGGRYFEYYLEGRDRLREVMLSRLEQEYVDKKNIINLI